MKGKLGLLTIGLGRLSQRYSKFFPSSPAMQLGPRGMLAEDTVVLDAFDSRRAGPANRVFVDYAILKP